MGRGAAERFRITHWPGQRVPEPGVWPVEAVEVHEGGWLGLRMGVVSESVAAPPELYLRQVRDVDVQSVDDLVNILRLGQWVPGGGSDLGLHDAQVYAEQLTRFAIRQHHDPNHIEDVCTDAAYQHVRRFEHPVHITEIGLRVSVLRQAAEHVIRYQRTEPVAPAWPYLPDVGVKRLPDGTLLMSPEIAAWQLFKRMSDAALSRFHVRVNLSDDPDQQTAATLYDVAWLQLANDLADDTPFRTCANEPCGRTFKRQLGRADYGQYRTEGIRFCSAACAKAQAQREYRRRNKKGPQHG